MRAVILQLALIGLLAGCGNSQDSPGKAAWAALKGAVSQIGKTPAPSGSLRAKITEDVLAQAKQSVMFAELPARKAEASMLALSDDAGHVTWLTADGITLLTRSGVLVQTRGLGQDIIQSDARALIGAVGSGQKNAQYQRKFSYLTGDDKLTSMTFDCTYTRRASIADETCRLGNVEIENRYVFDQAGRISRSTQWISPSVGYIKLEILKRV